MNIIEEKFFHEIISDDICGCVIILDIDGTLTCSSQVEISEDVIRKIRALQKNNTVYVFSNNFNSERSRRIAQQIHVPYIEAPHKKPNKKILRYIDHGAAPIISIGDKYLTDGLFAYFANAIHIRVRRYRCTYDGIADRAACLCDDVAYTAARMIGMIKIQDVKERKISTRRSD